MTLQALLEATERRALVRAYAAEGSWAGAARRLDLSLRTLFYRLRKYRLHADVVAAMTARRTAVPYYIRVQGRRQMRQR